MTKKNSVPERWTAYKNIGQQIAGTQFVAFKVPLGEKYFFKLRTSDRFTPNDLLEIRPDLGLIIDLTNTDRYYSSEWLVHSGIRHYKVTCPGKVIPADRIVRRFCNIVHEFLESNATKDALIGVHCTHGVNRTGYMICSYMVRHMLMNPRDAIAAFEAARGHPIERKEYIDALLNLRVDGSLLNGQRIVDDDNGGDQMNAQWNRSEESSHRSWTRGSRKVFHRRATTTRMNSDPWAPAPGPEADPWPPAFGSGGATQSTDSGPVAGPSRRSSHGPTHEHREGPVRKKKYSRGAKAHHRSASRLDADQAMNERPWRSSGIGQGSSHQEHQYAAGSSNQSHFQYARGNPARGRCRWEMDARSTSSHLASPRHLPRLPQPQSSSSLPSSAGLEPGRWGLSRHKHANEPDGPPRCYPRGEENSNENSMRVGRGNRDHGNRNHGNRDHGNRDHGNRNRGNRNHGNRNHGNRDHGNRDHGHRVHGNRGRGGRGCDDRGRGGMGRGRAGAYGSRVEKHSASLGGEVGPKASEMVWLSTQSGS